MSHPPSSYGIWFYCDCTPPTISLCLLVCLWMWGIFFGEFQCLPVDDCPAASCDSGFLTRGSESTSLYSAIFLLNILPAYENLSWRKNERFPIFMTQLLFTYFWIFLSNHTFRGIFEFFFNVKKRKWLKKYFWQQYIICVNINLPYLEVFSTD